MERTVSQPGQARTTPQPGALREPDRVAHLAGNAGHAPDEQLPGTPCPTGLPVIDSPAAAGQALRDLFLANADRGDDAANDDLVAELVRRIRAAQNSRDNDQQFDNSPDSGRPLVEPPHASAPSGRPDTTTPVGSASPATDAAEHAHPSEGREQPGLPIGDQSALR